MLWYMLTWRHSCDAPWERRSWKLVWWCHWFEFRSTHVISFTAVPTLCFSVLFHFYSDNIWFVEWEIIRLFLLKRLGNRKEEAEGCGADAVGRGWGLMSCWRADFCPFKQEPLSGGEVKPTLRTSLSPIFFQFLCVCLFWLSCLWDLSSQPGIEPKPLAVESSES